MTILPYKESDYSGEFNILKAQKTLILKAYKVHEGDLDKMAKALNMKRVDLLIGFVRHFTSSSSEHVRPQGLK